MYQYAFKNTKLKEIKIPESVVNNQFGKSLAGCDELEYLEIGSVSDINVFGGIGYIFDCEAKDVPKSLKKIKINSGYAPLFINLENIEEIIFGKDVTYVPYQACLNCSKLNVITFEDSNGWSIRYEDIVIDFTDYFKNVEILSLVNEYYHPFIKE